MDNDSTSTRLRVINRVKLRNGRVGLTTRTKTQTLRSLGTSNVESFAPATEQDVAWVRGMGGHVPEGRIAKQKEAA